MCFSQFPLKKKRKKKQRYAALDSIGEGHTRRPNTKLQAATKLLLAYVRKKQTIRSSSFSPFQ